jgi:nicotinamide-nucleotide amidase
MRAAIIAVGSELLGSDRLDTNSLRLTESLRRYGVELVGKSVVGDSMQEIGDWVRLWLERVDLILITGGLGPTRDDLTREAVAETLGRRLIEDPEIVEIMRERFRSFGMEMPDSNLRQAGVPEGARVLDNPRGTAPGLRLESEGKTLFLFPGVPSELDQMISTDLTPWLEKRSGGVRVESRVVRVACRSESAVEEDLAPLYEEFGRENLTVLASPGDIQVRFTAALGAREGQERLARMVARAGEVLGRAVYAIDQPETLEGTVGELLKGGNLTLATAESCTAGLLAERLTRAAGSSEYFLGGLVTYSNRSKRDLLGIDASVLESEGAVSQTVAVAMASGARERFGSDIGVGITGVAGPGGGSESKPVGTVHVALSGHDLGRQHRQLKLPGERWRVRQMASQWALEMIRRALLRPPGV